MKIETQEFLIRRDYLLVNFTGISPLSTQMALALLQISQTKLRQQHT